MVDVRRERGWLVLVTGVSLVRPFFGVGGFATFSAYAAEAGSLTPVIALSHVFGTSAGLVAVLAGGVVHPIGGPPVTVLLGAPVWAVVVIGAAFASLATVGSG